MIAVAIGTVIGAVSSAPVTNALLGAQTSGRGGQSRPTNQDFGDFGNFGDFGDFGDFPGDMPSGMPSGMPSDFPSGMPGTGSGYPSSGEVNGGANSITEVDYAVNATVVLEVIGIGLFLTFVASAASLPFVISSKSAKSDDESEEVM